MGKDSKIKSILRYPGGKSKALEKIMPYFPEGIKEVASPFFGGGSVEFHLLSKNVKIKGYDSFCPLVTFWIQVQKNREEIYNIIKNKYFPLNKDNFLKIQKEILKEKDPKEIAAMFYSINRSSFSGATLSGGMSPNHPRFNENSLKKLKDFKLNENISFECKDFKESISENEDVFLYCDPPYFVKSLLYGKNGDKHKNFDHQALFYLLSKRDRWILSYNDCEEIRNLYKDFKIIELNWSYGMNKSKESSELIILSKDLS